MHERESSSMSSQKLLDLALALDVVGEEVACHTHPCVRNAEVGPEERDEKAQDLGVGVRERNGVASLAAFSPVEHAPGGMEWVAAPSERASLSLRTLTPSPPTSSDHSVPAPLGIGLPVAFSKSRALRRRQLDVPHPAADGGSGDPQRPLDLLHRESALSPQTPGFFAFDCLHMRQQRRGEVGLSGRRESKPRNQGGNLELYH